MTNGSLAKIIEEAIEAYNDQDFDAYKEFFSPNLKFTHHNRGFGFDNRDDFITTLKTFASDLIPNRRLHPAYRVTEVGNTVVREQEWGGTAVTDVPGIAKEGEAFTLEFCTVYLFDGTQVVEYHEYG